MPYRNESRQVAPGLRAGFGQRGEAVFTVDGNGNPPKSSEQRKLQQQVHEAVMKRISLLVDDLAYMHTWLKEANESSTKEQSRIVVAQPTVDLEKLRRD